MSTHTCPWWFGYTFDNPLRRFFHDPSVILDGLVAEGHVAVDVGCGLGYFSLAMAGMVGERGRVLALDIQPQMLERAQARARRAGVDGRIEFRQCEPERLGLAEPVDFVLAFWMVHEVRNRAAFLAEIAAALRPRGLLLIVEPKIHVPARSFARTLESARAAGFDIASGPRVRFSRSAVCAAAERDHRASEHDSLREALPGSGNQPASPDAAPEGCT